ncbi:MAG: hypothetical protein ACJ74Y_12485 [Bryobacteraceae bacterium]
MNRAHLTRSEVASALTRGVRQLVFIGGQKTNPEHTSEPSDASLHVFAVDEKEPVAPALTFVRTRFASEELESALSRTSFDKLKVSLFVWFGDAGYRTMKDALSALSFIASLPKGSGIVFDYATERQSGGSLAGTALDALASRFSCASGAVKYLIQPQGVAAMLRGLGFGHIMDHVDEEVSHFDRHIVSALV